jgi:hypothetical protein
MAKIIKLKLNDIENIVRKTLRENEMMEDDMEMGDKPKRKASIMIDDDGNHFVIDDETKMIYGIVTKDGIQHNK